MFLTSNAEVGRSDVQRSNNAIVFTQASKSDLGNFELIIVDDDVLEFNELFIAEFDFDPEISNRWNVRKGEPSTAFILIRDDDCELCSDSIKPKQLFSTIFYGTLYYQVATPFLSIFVPL